MKKTLALGLVFVLLLGCLPLGTAAQEAAAVPVIIVNGMSAVPLLGGEGSKTPGENLFPSVPSIILTVLKLLPALIHSLVTRDMHALGEALSRQMLSMFDGWLCSPDGTSKNPVTVKQYPKSYAEDPAAAEDGVGNGFSRAELAQAIGAENVYSYASDWRLDIMADAVQLHEYIENVKADRGAQKVTLVAVSMGGAIALAYLQLYGYDSVCRLGFLSSTHNGTYFISDFFTGRTEVNADVFAAVMTNLTAGIPLVGGLVGGLMRLGKDSGKLNGMMAGFNAATAEISEVTNANLLLPFLGYMPSAWSMIPPEDYAAAKEFMLDETLHAELIAKIDNYYNNVGSRTAEILAEAKAHGIPLFFTSHYGIGPLLPIGKGALTQSDSIADTRGTSGGAVCAVPGTVLGSGYVQQNSACGHNHLSADGILDASAALYPEYTWFVKNMSHTDYGKAPESMEFLIWLICTEGQVTVSSNPRFPQFNQLDSAAGKFLPLT